MQAEKRNDVVYRCIGDDFSNGILSCGYMAKETAARSQYDCCIDYYSCFVLLSGTGFYIDGEGNRTMLSAGSFVQRRPGELHSIEVVPDGRWSEFYISFGKNTYISMRELGILQIEQPVSYLSVTRDFHARFESLLRHLRSAQTDTLYQVLQQAQDLTVSMHHAAGKGQDVVRAAMAEACSLLGSDLSRNIQPEEIADRLCLGYENFRKQFKKEIGLSPAEYRLKEKIKVARLMLLDGNSVGQVARQLGYSEASAFSKQFKKNMGVSPARYKNTYRQ
ncbi:MAG TPA: AraC family transcriptional regulator [Firmicutes bacterium]|nr:AraC family transcriptional regulator [Bacillota bacterium]